MLGLFASQPAAASDKDPCAAGMVCASKPTTIVDALQAAGFRATLSKGEDGDPKVESSAEGYKFSIFFYGCQKAELCDSLQFWISFADDGTNTPELANKWNNKRRFGQMAVSDAKSLSMSYDVTTMGGLPAKNFADVIEWWATMLGELGKFFKENGPPAPAK
ncbi:MAG: YbjN domain-containing protein [Sphingobium sp.]